MTAHRPRELVEGFWLLGEPRPITTGFMLVARRLAWICQEDDIGLIRVSAPILTKQYGWVIWVGTNGPPAGVVEVLK